MILLAPPLEIQGSGLKLSIQQGSPPFLLFFSLPPPSLAPCTLNSFFPFDNGHCVSSELCSVWVCVHRFSQKTSINSFSHCNTIKGNSLFVVNVATGHHLGAGIAFYHSFGHSPLWSDGKPRPSLSEPQDELRRNRKSNKAEMISTHLWGRFFPPSHSQSQHSWDIL